MKAVGVERQQPDLRHMDAFYYYPDVAHRLPRGAEWISFDPPIWTITGEQ